MGETGSSAWASPSVRLSVDKVSISVTLTKPFRLVVVSVKDMPERDDWTGDFKRLLYLLLCSIVRLVQWAWEVVSAMCMNLREESRRRGGPDAGWDWSGGRMTGFASPDCPQRRPSSCLRSPPSRERIPEGQRRCSSVGSRCRVEDR